MVEIGCYENDPSGVAFGRFSLNIVSSPQKGFKHIYTIKGPKVLLFLMFPIDSVMIFSNTNKKNMQQNRHFVFEYIRSGIMHSLIRMQILEDTK